MPWCSGAVVRWCSGAVVRWRRGAVVQWCGGAVVPWRNGAVVRVVRSRRRCVGFGLACAVLVFGVPYCVPC